MNFEWDTVKAATNLRKHGVSFEIAARAFEDELSATFPDPDHSSGETRLITGALAQDGRLLVISHTENLAPYELLAPEPQRVEKGNAMKPKKTSDDKDECVLNTSLTSRRRNEVAMLRG